MKQDNPLDCHLKTNGTLIPEPVREAATFTADTLHIAWLAAQSVFEDKATPELALAVLGTIRRYTGTHPATLSSSGGVVLKTGSPVHAPNVIHATGIGSNWLVPNANPSSHAWPRRINDSRARFTTA